MSPLTHLLASWVAAAKTTDNLRDRRLVTLAGVLPDLDGLGLVADIIQGQALYYPKYHHWLTHGLPAAVVCAGLLAMIGKRKCRVLLWSFVTFHLHLLCDYVGSRGPGIADKWPICYLGPLSRKWTFYCPFQWRLDGWQNQVITIVLLIWCTILALRMGDSFVGVFNHRFDRIFVATLRKWFRYAGKDQTSGPV